MAAESVLLKARIAMLWVFIGFVLVARQMLNGFQLSAAGESPLQVAPVFTVWGAVATMVLFAIPFLCLTLKDSPNRWMNLLLGLFFTVAGIVGTGSELLQFDASNLYFYLTDTGATVAPAIVFFYAYRWPKESV